MTALTVHDVPVFVGNWQKFKISDVFDSVTHPRARSKKKYEKGTVYYVASGSENNGVDDYLMPLSKSDVDMGSCLTVSPVDGSTFYQKHQFLGRGGGGSAIIILRSSIYDLSETAFLFLAGTISKKLKELYSYSSMGNSEIIKRTLISLPVMSSGQPDFGYMAKYIEMMQVSAQYRLQDYQNVDK